MRRKENWFIAAKKADFDKIGERFNISPILSRLIRNRDIINEQEIDVYLDGDIADLGDGMLMKDMDIVVDILKEKIHSQALIRVIGDYDIDGVNGTYVLKEGIRLLGGNVDTDIPDRMTDGYGLNLQLIDRALRDKVDTIITCDNGIAAVSEIAYGKSKGLTIIVTDHHKVPYASPDGEDRYILPPADGVVNPHRRDCTYEFKELCGAAVAYKVVEALFEVLNHDVRDIDYLIENVALATIGDIMVLQGENRIFVKRGLEMLRQTKNLGLQALMEVVGINPKDLTTYHLGFVIGPCINAGGRMETAKKALDLLSSKTYKEALILARELKELNDRRKELTMQQEDAANIIAGDFTLMGDKVLVIYLENCHQSIAGIVAGRIRDRYYRPTIILTPGNEEGEVKGSGRSIEAYDLYEELSRCSELFIRYGGHTMACGLSLTKGNVETLRKRLNENNALTAEDLIEKVSIDMVLPFQYANIELVDELKRLEPFGKGNKTPLFAARDVKVLYPKLVGANENVLSFKLEDAGGITMRGVHFEEAKEAYEYLKNKRSVDITFTPKTNEWNGQKTIDLVVKNYR
jgi:single-stranded-DNA-specific exonuclease